MDDQVPHVSKSLPIAVVEEGRHRCVRVPSRGGTGKRGKLREQRLTLLQQRHAERGGKEGRTTTTTTTTTTTNAAAAVRVRD